LEVNLTYNLNALQMLVSYPFDGLVLVGAWTPEGCLAQHADILDLAADMAVMTSPSIVGSAKQIVTLLPKILTLSRRDVSADSEAPPMSKGWMVSYDAKELNLKLIHKEYTRAAQDRLLMHPLAVWDRVRCSGESPEALLLRRLSQNFREELANCLSALEESYNWIRREVEIVLCRLSENDALESSESSEPVTSIQSHRLSTASASGWFSPAVSQPMMSSKIEQENVSNGQQKQSSLKWSEQGPLSLSFRLALDYAVLKKSAGPISMYWQKQSASKHGKMRCLLLDCIKPEYNGSLPGYSPSSKFLEMLPAQGWGSGPRAGRLAISSSSPSSMLMKMLNSELIAAVLVKLKVGNRWAVRRASLVCHEWHCIVDATPEFQKDGSDYEEAVNWQGSDSDSDDCYEVDEFDDYSHNDFY
jgi:hypothetical protein